jgi:Protein of unknown function (DUF3037)
VSPDRLRYDYAVLRAVPRVERGEFMNVGVIVWCPQARLLALRHACDSARLQALDPRLDLPTLQATLEALARHCTTAASESTQVLRQTFDFIVAARSAVLQVSPVHTGLTTDVDRLPRALMDRFVSAPAR